jgi:hypothetical protein
MALVSNLHQNTHTDTDTHTHTLSLKVNTETKMKGRKCIIILNSFLHLCALKGNDIQK